VSSSSSSSATSAVLQQQAAEVASWTKTKPRSKTKPRTKVLVIAVVATLTASDQREKRSHREYFQKAVTVFLPIRP
jgi:hypothetical protein